ncbi:MAG: hypothetical protein ABR548_00285 [Actinomycetota bacterium]
MRSILSACAVAAVAVTTLFIAGPANAGTAPMRFSHAVVVDQQRSGFEADIAVDGEDRIYTSVPNGSSTTTSWVWRSVDHGDTFQLVPGNVAGRTTTCLQGGGDTELQVDAKGNLYLSDLQNLTNLTNSVSTDHGATFLSSCAGAPNTPVDRMWYAIQGSLGDPKFRIYEEYDAVASGLDMTDPADPKIGNQLVEIVSTDGVNFVPVVNANPGPACLGGGAINCVTNNEGLPGNQVIAKNGDILIAHTGRTVNGSERVVVSRGKMSGDFPAITATWTDVELNAKACPQFDATTENLGKTEICDAVQFPTIAQDTAGNFYVAFSSRTKKVETVDGAPTLVQSGPYTTYVATSHDGDHWSEPVKVSAGGSNAFSWITAGAPGRAAVAWYHADIEHGDPPTGDGVNGVLASLNDADPHGYLFDDLQDAEFDVQVAYSLDALSADPTWNVQTITEHPIKHGPICTRGTTCSVTQGDRSLGDFLMVSHDSSGALIFSFVDDTSGYYSTGPTGIIANSGPTVIVRQIGGPSLLGGTIGTRAPVFAGLLDSLQTGAVTDRSGDAAFNGVTLTSDAGANLDIVGTDVQTGVDGIDIHIKVADASSLLVSPTAGGTTGLWFVRFTTYDRGNPGNGHIYYAGAESILGGAPRFFAGEPKHVRYITYYDSSTPIEGSVEGNAITLHVPYSMIGDHKVGTRLFSVTAFSATAAGTLANVPNALFNQVDATAPFNYDIRGTNMPVFHAKPTQVKGARHSLPSTGVDEQFASVMGAVLLAGAYAIRRRLVR